VSGVGAGPVVSATGHGDGELTLVTGLSRSVAAVSAVLIGFAVAVSVGCRADTIAGGTSTAGTVRSRGLVASIRGEPQSFNGFVKRDASTALVTLLTQAKLVRINRATGEVEPWLALGWTRSNDGLRYTIKLRPNATFADGHPFTADDVVFSFAAAYDDKSGSVLADSLQVGGRKLRVAALDPLTVIVTFPAPFAPGLRLLDNLVMLPKHKLAASLAAGTFATVWNRGTPPDQITGLGPFMLADYIPGQRLVFTRNPRYFRTDAAGAPLPYLDSLVVEVVSEQDTDLLQLQSGELDVMTSEIRPQDYAPLKRAADAGRLQLLDLGAAYDPETLWFNLKPGAFGGDPRAAWLQRDEFRQAVSFAVDRQQFADMVYLGAAVPVYGPITPANKKWYSSAVPKTPYDPARAKTLLASIGLTDQNGDGVLEDRRGAPARFTLLTQKGQTSLERGCAFIREELKKIGVVVDVVPLERNAVIQTFLSGRGFDAVYFHVGTTDTDPAINPDFWLSSGTAHVWNPMQSTPATSWERRIDELMMKQIASSDDAERKQLFDEVQKIFAEHLPVIHFAAPNVFVAASPRVVNITPVVARPQLLWSADTLAVRD
jgi:peptide/nickel transport system substrate-binding protein